MPVLQIGRITDLVELRRHEWSTLHHRVWVKPAIIQTLEVRLVNFVGGGTARIQADFGHTLKLFILPSPKIDFDAWKL